jgi:PAS domain S-box-containing protein
MNDTGTNARLIGTDLAFLSGGGELGSRIREHDWASTPLGPPQIWPQSLKTAVRIMLSSRQPIWIGWGPDLLYLYNDPYKSIIGGKHPWALGQPTKTVWQEIWHEIGPQLATAMGGVEGTYVEQQLLIMERNGYPEEVYYTYSYTPVPNDDGNPGGIICANTEDTERVIGERQLALLRELGAASSEARTWQEACERCAAALTSNPRDLPFAMIYSVEPGTQSATLSATAGIDPRHPASVAVVALDDGASVWPIGQALRERSLQLALLEGPHFEALPTGLWANPARQAAVLPILASGGSGRSGALAVGLSPVRQLDDNYRGFLTLVAGQIAAAIANADSWAQERRRAEALAELDRAKTAFFANVSHEFRTPLTLMLGPLEEMKSEFGSSGSPLSIPQYQRLDLVHRNGLRLLKLTNTLLDFSRIEAGRHQASYEPTDLAALTAELASMFRSATEKASLKLTVDCPSLDEPAYVDRDMWEKIVLNLISNAFKYTFEGEIKVKLQRSGKHFELSVRDTGTGIPHDQLPHIFERFHRVADARGRTHEGSGIGLALVQELVRLHSGSVAVESTLGWGSTFHVFIPCGLSHLPHRQIGGARGPTLTALGAQPFVEEALRWLPDADGLNALVVDTDAVPSLEATPANDANRPRIVLADDNVDMRDYLRRLLAGRYDVEAVADGEGALAAITRKIPDLVLTDVMMPGLDGFGLLLRIRGDAHLASIPVILLSARAGEEARVEGLKAGADDYVIKPFSARELLARVESNLKLSQTRRHAEERISSILESMTDGFYVVDASWRFTYFNGAAKHMFAVQGVDASALVGKHIFDEAFPEARASEAGRALIACMKERRPTDVEAIYQLWKRWFSVRCYPAPDGGAATFFQDITERKETEARQKLLLDELNHRVKNTLAVIQSIAAQTLRDTPEPCLCR